jgi:hypothetical protein
MAALLLCFAPRYFLLGILKHLVPLQRLACWMWRSPEPRSDPEHAKRMVAAIMTLSRIGADKDCVQRSLLLYRVLSRSGADPLLIVGFRRSGKAIMGHAWVVVRGRAVTHPDGEEIGFSPAFGFSREGALQRM